MNYCIAGVAIVVTVFIVVNVMAGNDYMKEKQFRKLNAQAEDEKINIIRGFKILGGKKEEERS